MYSHTKVQSNVILGGYNAVADFDHNAQVQAAAKFAAKKVRAPVLAWSEALLATICCTMCCDWN